MYEIFQWWYMGIIKEGVLTEAGSRLCALNSITSLQ